MIGGRPAEILVAVGAVEAVFQRPDRAVFCRVGLRHYLNPDGTPLQAIVRLCVPYLGPGWGDWWVPDQAADLICFFPGVGTNGAAGGELDEGYAFGVISSLEEPPVDGLRGALAPGRRVYKGRPATAHDWHFQGDLDAQIDANETRLVKGNFDHTVELNETRLVQGDRDVEVEGNEARVIQGDLDREIQGSEQSENVGIVTRTFRALAEWIGDIKLAILCDLIEVGAQAGVFQKLLNRTAMDTFNNHIHPGTGTPTTQMSEDVDTTINLRAS